MSEEWMQPALDGMPEVPATEEVEVELEDFDEMIAARQAGTPAQQLVALDLTERIDTDTLLDLLLATTTA